MANGNASSPALPFFAALTAEQYGDVCRALTAVSSAESVVRVIARASRVLSDSFDEARDVERACGVAADLCRGARERIDETMSRAYQQLVVEGDRVGGARFSWTEPASQRANGGAA
jgi:hypothetical protein